MNDIVPIRVAKDAHGNWWSLDNRRLYCFKTSDIDVVPATKAPRDTSFWHKERQQGGLGSRIKFRKGSSK